VDIVWWHLAIHRAALIREALRAGYRVHVALPPGGDERALQALGAEVHKIDISRKGMEPFQEIAGIGSLLSLYRKVLPDLVHHLTLKPVLYGTIAAAAARVPAVVNAVTGLGYLFDDHGFGFRAARTGGLCAAAPIFRRRNVYFVFQNDQDRLELEGLGLAVRGRTALIPGSGVDVERFAPCPPPDGIPVVVLPARILKSKGVLEFVEAARQLRKAGVVARFALAGAPDPGNPLSIPANCIQEWVREGVVEWAGWVSDMAGLLARSHVVCLPSYREGLPMTLLEALAAGRPIVTTDVAGCRDAVTHGVHGFLVPPRNPSALAEAIRCLIEDPALRTRMGAAGRERAVREFSTQRICRETLALYARVLGENNGRRMCRDFSRSSL
jgi:glycosyltransferase involved in cell wall biosynthesis